ncbi:uncharacterized protein TRAVEDRAFT_53552 [Trametes versicolor FP-101664 SS1]|uniref:uncharacterized protein n=1 Tax=Trametes versicolor (strain FP-101664) TaxID=717944 RepID=UPI00046235B1|nr:uncharacterized protein TRAVEDRAFT_53552 [Trametes versicolor FP-101664 SS1]EIW53140.1 hypothetical protein TRAVEDRAFT_53552 [Trametes versicolor FP-101664 SS1]
MDEIPPTTLQRLLEASGPTAELSLPSLHSRTPTAGSRVDKGKGIETNPFLEDDGPSQSSQTTQGVDEDAGDDYVADQPGTPPPSTSRRLLRQTTATHTSLRDHNGGVKRKRTKAATTPVDASQESPPDRANDDAPAPPKTRSPAKPTMASLQSDIVAMNSHFTSFVQGVEADRAATPAINDRIRESISHSEERVLQQVVVAIRKELSTHVGQIQESHAALITQFDGRLRDMAESVDELHTQAINATLQATKALDLASRPQYVHADAVMRTDTAVPGLLAGATPGNQSVPPTSNFATYPLVQQPSPPPYHAQMAGRNFDAPTPSASASQHNPYLPPSAQSPMDVSTSFPHAPQNTHAQGQAFQGAPAAQPHVGAFAPPSTSTGAQYTSGGTFTPNGNWGAQQTAQPAPARPVPSNSGPSVDVVFGSHKWGAHGLRNEVIQVGGAAFQRKAFLKGRIQNVTLDGGPLYVCIQFVSRNDAKLFVDTWQTYRGHSPQYAEMTATMQL